MGHRWRPGQFAVATGRGGTPALVLSPPAIRAPSTNPPLPPLDRRLRFGHVREGSSRGVGGVAAGGFELRASGFKLQASSFELRVLDFGSFKLRDSALGSAPAAIDRGRARCHGRMPDPTGILNANEAATARGRGLKGETRGTFGSPDFRWPLLPSVQHHTDATPTCYTRQARPPDGLSPKEKRVPKILVSRLEGSTFAP